MIYRYETKRVELGLCVEVHSRGGVKSSQGSCAQAYLPREAIYQQKLYKPRKARPNLPFPHSWGKYPPFGGGWGAIARPVLASPCSPHQDPRTHLSCRRVFHALWRKRKTYLAKQVQNGKILTTRNLIARANQQ